MHTFVRIDIMVVRPPVEVRIRHLHHFHNAPFLPPPPPILHNVCFSFLLGITAVPREIGNNAYAKFWGVNKVHYERGASGEYFAELRLIS